MRTKQEILKEKGIYIGFKSTYDMDSIFKAMQEYAEEYHRTELLKLNKSDVISSVCECKYDEKRRPKICSKCLIEITGID
mgnify:CR=1 FL=1